MKIIRYVILWISFCAFSLPIISLKDIFSTFINENLLLITICISIIVSILFFINLFRKIICDEQNEVIEFWLNKDNTPVHNYLLYNFITQKETVIINWQLFGKDYKYINLTSFADFKNYISNEDYQKLNRNIKSIIVKYNNNILLPDQEKKEFIIKFSVNESSIYLKLCLEIFILGNQNRGVIIWLENISKQYLKDQKINQKISRLKKQKELYISIIDVLPIAIWGRSKRIFYGNKFYQKFVNFDKKNKNLPPLSSEMKNFFSHNTTTRKLCTQDMYIVHEGKRKLYEINEKPLNDKLSIGFAFDNSREEHLKKEIKRYINSQHHFLNAISSAVAIFSQDTKISFYNIAFVKLWHLDEKWLQSIPKYDEFLDRLRSEQKIADQVNFKEFKINNLKMFIELVDIHNEFLYLPDGRSIRMMVIPYANNSLLFHYEDITSVIDLKRSYNSLVNVHKATLDNLKDAISVFGEDGKLQLYNKTYCTLWNINSSFLEKKPHINEILEMIKTIFDVDNIKLKELLNHITSLITYPDQETLRLHIKSNVTIDCISKRLPNGNVMIMYTNILANNLNYKMNQVIKKINLYN